MGSTPGKGGVRAHNAVEFGYADHAARMLHHSSDQQKGVTPQDRAKAFVGISFRNQVEQAELVFQRNEETAVRSRTSLFQDYPPTHAMGRLPYSAASLYRSVKDRGARIPTASSKTCPIARANQVHLCFISFSPKIAYTPSATRVGGVERVR